MNAGESGPYASRYRSGSWAGLATRDTWLLVDLTPNNPHLTRLWTLIQVPTTVDSVLDELVSAGFGSTPAFALVRHDEDHFRVLVRGDARVDLTATDQESSRCCEPGLTWLDFSFPSSDLVRLSVSAPVGDTAVAALPLAGGIASACEIVISPTTSTNAHDRFGTTPGISPREEVEEDASLTPLATPTDPGTYDHLFSVQVGPETSTGTGPTPQAPGACLTHEVPTGSVPSTAGARALGSPNFSIPQTADETPDADSASSSSTSAVDADLGEQTILRSEADGGAAPGGPAVLAVHCPSGHASDPHQLSCQVCGSPIPDQRSVLIARPPLGTLTLPTGETITLERSVRFGRAPDVPSRGTTERQNAVCITHPMLSRHHAEVVVDGWNVYVIDLGSSNGTTVTTAGGQPVLLRESEPFLLQCNASIALAEEVVIQFEVRVKA